MALGESSLTANEREGEVGSSTSTWPVETRRERRHRVSDGVAGSGRQQVAGSVT